MAWAKAWAGLAILTVAATAASVGASHGGDSHEDRYVLSADGKLVPEGEQFDEGEVAFLRTNTIRCRPWRTEGFGPRDVAAGTAAVHLEFHFPNDIDGLTVRIGKFDGAFVSAGGESQLLGLPTDTDGDVLPDRSLYAFNVPLSGQTFAAGDELALEVCADTAILNGAILYADGSSYLELGL